MKAPHVVFQTVVQPSAPVHPVSSESTASSPSFWQRLLEQLSRWLIVSKEIKVVERCDRAGNVYYQIHDLHSGQTKVFYSEADALVWLDRERF